MAGDEELRRISDLAREFGIRSKPSSVEPPAAHKETVEPVHDLGRIDFKTYAHTVDGQRAHEIWRQDNVARARSLADKAYHLSESKANESKWRMHVENDIFRQFSSEVACPGCEKRVWRSEIEPSLTDPSRMREELYLRRRNRAICDCSPEDRASRYELESSKIFDYCVDVTVPHMVPIEGLGNLKPDRVIGLTETNKIGRIMDQPPSPHVESQKRRIRDLVLSTPFTTHPKPLLYPFLIVEAKPDNPRRGFVDIQTQTAFPIKSLLSLQHDLQSHSLCEEGETQPFVWFFAYKGSDWKVYGCYMECDDGPKTTYNIHHLATVDISTRDGALRLLLLVDYVVDWARDIYRTTIITRLRTLATGRPFDEVSLGLDSDIVSMRQATTSLTLRAANNVLGKRASDTCESVPFEPEHRNRSDQTSSPNTTLGAVRHLTHANFQLTGLRISKGNVESYMALSDDYTVPYSTSARKLLNELTRWDEVLVVLGADLDSLERVWSDQADGISDPLEESPETEYYAIFEYRCFVDDSWNVIREMSFLAISVQAFTILQKQAAPQRINPRIAKLPGLLRHCSDGSLFEAVECLKSGSSWQVFCAALASTMISLCPEPERRRSDIAPPVSVLGLGFPSFIRVSSVVCACIKEAEKTRQPRKPNMRNPQSEHARKRLKAHNDALEAVTHDKSFRRTSQQTVRMSTLPHVASECGRCKTSRQDIYELRNWDPEITPSLTAYGAVLVESLRNEEYKSSKPQERHDLSLFILDDDLWMSNTIDIPDVVIDLTMSDLIYHTIRHDPEREAVIQAVPRATLWNLPSALRKYTHKQRWDIARWLDELDETRPKPEKELLLMTYPWVHLQILLFFLRRGLPYEEAICKIIQFRTRKIDRHRASVPPHIRNSLPFNSASWVVLRDFWTEYPLDPAPQADNDPIHLPTRRRLRGD